MIKQEMSKLTEVHVCLKVGQFVVHFDVGRFFSMLSFYLVFLLVNVRSYVTFSLAVKEFCTSLQ